MFKACALMTPFYRLPDPETYRKFLTPVKILNYILPYFPIPPSRSEPTEEYKAKWGHVWQFPMESTKACPRIIIIWEEQQWTVLEELKKTKIPFSVSKASEDNVVSNKAIDDWMSVAIHPLT